MAEEPTQPVAQRIPVPVLAWLIWGTTMLLALVVLGLSVINLAEMPWEFGQLLIYQPAVAVDFLVASTIGLMILRRHPQQPIGWLLLATTLAAAVASLSQLYSGFALVVSSPALPGGDAAALLSVVVVFLAIVAFFALVPLLFPDGTLPSPRWRPLVWLAGLLGVLLVVGSFGTSDLAEASAWAVNPFGLSGPLGDALDSLFAIALLLGAGLILGGGAALITRYRRARGEERQQIKWVVVAFAVAVPLHVLTALIPQDRYFDSPPVLIFGYLAPLSAVATTVAIWFAISKYRLYDIDVVINKTLVYGALAAFIGAVYVAVVAGVAGIIGTQANNTVLLIVATVIVAVGFQPLRTWLQRLANRLVYGQRATPYEALSSFSERMGGAYPIAEVLGEMARVVAAGIGATRVDVWLRRGDRLEAEATWPEDAEVPDIRLDVDGDWVEAFSEADRAVAVHHQEGLLGAITFAKPRGERLTPVEEKLLDDFASQAGLVMRNASLTENLADRLEEIEARAAELQASRARIVTAQDQARRRLERNIHDGAQQHLVALAVKLGLAKQLATRDPNRAQQVLGEVDQETTEARNTLRDLARGIYPRTLTDQGLIAALQAETERLSIPTSIHANGIDRLPAEVEAAVYFSTLEALQNAAKYSAATHITVDLTQTNHALTFTITDNGQGFNPTNVPTGSGLANIEARLTNLDGQLHIESNQPHGTQIRGSIPIPVKEAR